MRPREELDFIRDRVLAEIRANPSVRPYLGEEEKQKPGPKPSVSPEEKRRRKNERLRLKRALRRLKADQ